MQATLVVLLLSTVRLASPAIVEGATAPVRVTAEGKKLEHGGVPFTVRGVNYYPKDYAWKLWTSYEQDGVSAQIDRELDEIEALGFNAVRIFTPFSVFGTHPKADPKAPSHLSDFLHRLEKRDLLAIVTLFDFYPDYLVDDASRGHVETIVPVLMASPAILAIDVKNEPDLDYDDAAPRAVIVAWLRAMIGAIQSIGAEQLVTIGFSGAIETTPSCDRSGFAFDPGIVAELAADVDIVSFHYFLPQACLIDDIRALRDAVADAKPILLEEFGLTTIPPRNERQQEAYLGTLFALSKSQNLAGQMIWTLNDFSMLFDGGEPFQSCFGILGNSLVDICSVIPEFDYLRKPGADAVRRHNGSEPFLDFFSGWVTTARDESPAGWLASPEEGVVMRGHDPSQPDRPFWSRHDRHAAVTKYHPADPDLDFGIARSPELRTVDVDRHPYLTGRVAYYEVQDEINGSDSLLHVGVEIEGEEPVRLLTVTPDTPLHGFDLDLRQPPLMWSGEQTFRIVLDLDPENPPENGYSASYELDCVGLSSHRLAGSCEPSACLVDPGDEPFELMAVRFLSSLVKPDTGLVSSLEPECFTTVYKNALAAFAFIHENELARAERIFSFFQSRIGPEFLGFHQAWDACTGVAFEGSHRWVGDNTFLSLALSYYARVSGGYGGFELLRDELANWLISQVDGCSEIVAEGTANMYAALVPHAPAGVLNELAECFYGDVIYSFVLDHTVRGALVFGDPRGFGKIAAFERAEIWQCDESTGVTGYAGFSPEDEINVEISAQLLTAWRIWQSGLDVDLAFLRAELEKLRLLSSDGSGSGLPFQVRSRGFATSAGLPIVDSTLWFLFDVWGLNPFAPGRTAASEIFIDGFESGDLTKWSASG